jgi:hypothetical protein
MKNYEKVLEYLKTQNVFNKHLYQHCIQVGSSVFPPICVYEDSMDIKVSERTHKNTFKKLIERVKQKFDFIEYGYYTANDSSYIPQLCFHFNTEIRK